MQRGGYTVWAHWKTHAAVEKILEGLKRGRLIDLAAGCGAATDAARRMGFEVTACDIQPENFKVPGLKCVRCDLNERMPFADGEFDCAVCIEGIEHLRDRYAFLKECYRILRPGGTLILTTPNVLNLSSRLRFFLGGFPSLFRPPNEFRPDPSHGHISPTPWYYLRHALVLAGFRNLRIQTDRFRRSALMLAWLYPVVVVAGMHCVRRERDGQQRQANREILRQMRSAPILFGRTLIAIAEKPAATSQ